METPLRSLVYIAVISLAACQDGCQGCDRQPSDSAGDSGDTNDTFRTDTGDSVVEEPHCAVNEIEPNPPPTPTELPMEQLGCGTIETGVDNDTWAFEVDHSTWVGVYVDAERIGSRANIVLTMSSDNGEAAQLLASPNSTDIRLRMPTPGDRFRVLITEQTATADADNYFYEILATEVKEPVTSNLNETEPNDSADVANEVVHGDSVWGEISGSTDDDFFYIDIPEGKHTITLDMQAWEYGSAGNFRIRRYDDGGATQETTDYLFDSDPIYDNGDGARTESDGDPYAVFESFGDERVYFKVVEYPERRGGKAYWYVIDVSVEGS